LKPIIKQEKEGRLEIQQRGVGFKVEKLFFEAIQEAILEGYRLPESPELLADFSFRNFQGMAAGKCVLFAEGKDPSLAKPVVEEVKIEVEDAPIVEPVVEDKVVDNEESPTVEDTVVEEVITEVAPTEIIQEVKTETPVATPKKKAGKSNKKSK
jgi:hypothetical protein